MASVEQIGIYLSQCDTDFIPPLSQRVNIDDYAKKIINNAVRFEAWSGDILIGLVASYFSEQERPVAYITSVSVLREWMRRGITSHLMEQCITYAKDLGIRQIKLEVERGNMPALKLYEKYGFIAAKLNETNFIMSLFL
jgi:ribosomal protein S18 acetylase RimI-like enzyme